MLNQRSLAALFMSTLLPVITCGADGTTTHDWPQFRGRRAAGVATGQHLPAHWNVESGENIRYKTRIPGLAHASPVTARGCLFVVTATSSNGESNLRVGLYGDIASVPEDTTNVWQLFCLCQRTGQILWQRTLCAAVPEIKRHTKATHANATPATDGQHIVVFLGSEGLYCYDFCGQRLWKKDFGILDSGYYVVPSAQWGFGSSPIIFENMVIVQCDVQQNSFIAALDVCTGRELWRTARQDVPTWSTPTIHDGPEPQLVVNGYRHAGGYDPWTGKELWWMRGGGDIPVPTPVISHDLIFLSSAHGRWRPLCAVLTTARGEVTPTADNSADALAWYLPRDGIYMQTPLVYGDLLYACRGNGVLSCYDALTGTRLYRERLGGEGGFTASPVAADGRLYFTSELGEVFVVQAGKSFNLIARNSMDDICMATPAISGGTLIVRTQHHIYGIGAPLSPDPQVACSTPAVRPAVITNPGRPSQFKSRRRRRLCPMGNSWWRCRCRLPAR